MNNTLFSQANKTQLIWENNLHESRNARIWRGKNDQIHNFCSTGAKIMRTWIIACISQKFSHKRVPELTREELTLKLQLTFTITECTFSCYLPRSTFGQSIHHHLARGYGGFNVKDSLTNQSKTYKKSVKAYQTSTQLSVKRTTLQ